MSAQERLREVFDNADYGLFLLGAIVVAIVTSRLTRAAITGLLGWVARRSRQGVDNFWVVRVPRSLSETEELAEVRRAQRVRASALMLSRFAAVAIWLLTIVIVLAVLDVDVVWAVSSAGFLGAAIAIGGQHSVHDYLNGVHILLEDRFGEGDEIEVTHPSGEIRRGRVVRIGAFGTELSGEAGSWHMANRLMGEVLNLSKVRNGSSAHDAP